MRFALNHIATPSLPLPVFLALARSLDMVEVEIRNDLPDVLGEWTPAQVRAEADRAGITILSVNALSPFNLWTDDLAAKAFALADYAADCGAKGVVMCPLNDGRAVRFDDLVAALAAAKPILQDRGLIGLIEPLGFPTSSLRSKAEAIRAIDAAEGAQTFKLVHDSFHHHLAGESQFFPDRTGLVHISGVTDPLLAVGEMRDSHRGLIDGGDRLDNLGQIRALRVGGYEGPFSFEPFASEVQLLADPAAALSESMTFLRARL